MTINAATNPDTPPQVLQTYTLLQLAAEAFLGVNREAPAAPGDTTKPQLAGNEKLLTDGNDHSSKMTTAQAAEFAANWKVVSHQPNTATGFSATLFEYIGDPLKQPTASRYSPNTSGNQGSGPALRGVGLGHMLMALAQAATAQAFRINQRTATSAISSTRSFNPNRGNSHGNE